MNFKIKTNHARYIFLIVFSFLLANFIFLKTEKVMAAYNLCYWVEQFTEPLSGTSSYTVGSASVSNQTECENLCKKYYSEDNCKYVPSTATEEEQKKAHAEIAQEANSQTGQIQSSQSKEVCAGISIKSPMTWVNCILLWVLQAMKFILEMASVLFTSIVDAKNLDTIINNEVIYATWVLVRDTLNISFILVLLFSAFCTIFQVSQYNYQKILLNLVIMALLVNFSYPISRVVIDFANSMMYYFLNSSTFGNLNSTGLFAKITDESALGHIIAPAGGAQASTSFLIIAIIFTFILAVTLITVAIMLLIRAVALAILIIFSSVGFVGTIVPFLSSYSKKFWNNLFEYAFFGPAMVFMIYVSVKMMENISIGKLSMGSVGEAQSGEPNFVATMAFFAIPIVILWVGIGTAKGMSVVGAKTILGGGQSFAKGAGKKISGYNWGKKNFDAYKKKRDERQAEIDKNRFGGKFGKWVNTAQDTMIGTKAAEKRIKNMSNTQFDENKKKASDRISNNEDAQTIVNNVIDSSTGMVNVNVNAMNQQQRMDFVGRYEQLKSDPAAKQTFESDIRGAHMADAIREASTRAAATGFAPGSPEYNMALESFKTSHLDRQVAQQWGNLNKQYKTAKNLETNA
jgi:hypothetical protein